MKRILTMMFILGLCCSFALSVFAQEEVQIGKEIIAQAQSLKTVKEKIDYLISQAQTFYNSENFQDVVEIAQYILQYLETR